jgi:trimeric autotransporter adhesin
MPVNTTGRSNTAVGVSAMNDNTVGSFNTAVGNGALDGNFGSNPNTAVGHNSGFGSPGLGFNNTLIGADTKVTLNGGFNSVALGQLAVCTGSNQVRFGNTSTTSIGGVVGYTNLSDGRYKKNIQESVKGIDFIMKLRPVMYQLDLEGLNAKLHPGRKSDELSKSAMAENEKTVFSGFVAQEVEQAAKDAGYNFSGIDKPKNQDDMYGLRYADFVVPMVKALQEQQQVIADLQKQVTELKSQIQHSK